MGSSIFLKALIILILLTISSSVQQDGDTTGPTAETDQKWNDFKMKFGKLYGSESEEEMRKQIFIENLKKNQAHNELYAKGMTSYTVGINQFHDMTQSEFTGSTICANLAPIYSDLNLTIFEESSRKLAESVDWRKKGYVTPVKNQGQCASCWAFAVTGALEAQNFRKTGKLVSLSEQNLVDCSQKYNNKGCNGGVVHFTITYISDNGGINSEESYPYEEINGTCRYQPNAVAATDDGFIFIRGEIKLQAAVADVGPVAVSMFVCESFRNYEQGIYDDETCSGNPGHAVLIVGYGTDNDTEKDYWIVKNSWGTSWGMDGYALVARNKRMCGIGYYSIHPIIFCDQPDENDD